MLSKTQQLLLVIGLSLSVVASADVDCEKKPKFVDPRTCCPMPEFISAELMEKCQRYNITPTTPAPMPDDESSEEGRHHHHHHHRHHHHHHHHPCLMSCVFNETGFYMNNSLDMKKLDGYLKLVFKDSAEVQALATEAFTTCANKIDTFKDKMMSRARPSPPPGMPVCPLRPNFLMGCVFKKMFKNCPDTIRTDSQECNDAKEYFDKCKPQHRRPSPPPNDEN